MGSIIGAVIQGGAAESAAGMQEQAANNATATQQGMFNTVQSNLAPYMNFGTTGMTAFANAANSGAFWPINMNQQTLQNTPGYQFTLNQGLQATQNGYAAQGLGSSGNAMMGAANYATGLASNTYQQQFSNALANEQNQFSQYMAPLSVGENAAAGVGNAAVQTGQGIAANEIGAGNAAAAGLNSAGSSMNSALTLNSLMNSANGNNNMYGNNAAMNNFMWGGMNMVDPSTVNWNS